MENYIIFEDLKCLKGLRSCISFKTSPPNKTKLSNIQIVRQLLFPCKSWLSWQHLTTWQEIFKLWRVILFSEKLFNSLFINGAFYEVLCRIIPPYHGLWPIQISRPLNENWWNFETFSDWVVIDYYHGSKSWYGTCWYDPSPHLL